jgi:hypothetical protein
MPEDVRLYSSASDDINRALAGRAVKRSIAGGVKTSAPAPAAAAPVAESQSSGAPFVLAGILAAVLIVGYWGGYLTKRKRRGAAHLGGPPS